MTKIIEANNHILIHADYENPARHRHKAAQIVISLDSRMLVEADGKQLQCRGIAIPSGMAHSIQTKHNQVLVFLYDSTSVVSKQLKDLRYLPDVVCDRILRKFHEYERKTCDYGCLECSLLESLEIRESKDSLPDSRIQSAMAYIRGHIPEPVTCREVADFVCLSQSRFSHLFSQQVGMTFAAYLIYQRLMHAYAGVIQGESLTEAAIGAGFSSSSHFADVNRRIFGLSASAITRDVVFVKEK